MANNTFPDEEEMMSRLYIARRQDRLSAEKFVVEAAERVAKKLNKMIETGHDDSAFMIALLLAAFKDFLDIVLDILLIGLIPGVSFFIGLFLTSFLFFFLLGKGWFLKTRLKIWFWILGLFVDGLPVFNALPTNVLLVLYAWHLAKKRARNAEENLEKLKEKTLEELEEIDKNTGIEDEDIE